MIAPVTMNATEQITLDVKERQLREILRRIGSCIVAFSGGVDSAYLAVVAQQELGESAIAVTAESPSYPQYQRDTAMEVASQFGLRHEFMRSAEMDDPNYAANPVNRCYFCKQELYTKLGRLARDRGIRWVVDGNNADDTGDYRPGQLAGRELAVRSPLIEAELGKSEVRQLSRDLGLPTWDLPASACLASRIPYGQAVTPEKLEMIDRGETVMRDLGFRQSRVRHHGDVARIEIAREDLPRALSMAMFEVLSTRFKEIGFRFVSVDVDGYRTGALNEPLHQIAVARRTGRSSS